MVRVIAEAGQCHGGDIGLAIEMADAAKEAGCWGMKLQFLTPDLIASDRATKYWQHGDSRPQRDVFADNGTLTQDELVRLRGYCAGIGLALGATPFDAENVDLARSLELDFLKIASGDVTNHRLVTAVAGVAAADDVELHVSTGAARSHEIAGVFERTQEVPRMVWMACSLVYPTPLHRAMLGRIPTVAALIAEWAEADRGWADFDSEYEIGYSDHTVETETSALAVMADAQVLEKHFSLTAMGDETDVPDRDMALNAVQMAEYVEWAHTAGLASGTALGPTQGERDAWVRARRSWFAARPISAGQTIDAEDVVALRPGPVPGAGRIGADEPIVGRVTDYAIGEGEPILKVALQYLHRQR